MRVLAARGVEFEADVPFAGLHELLRPALGLLDRLPPIHAAALRSSLGLGDRIEADRLIIGAAVLGPDLRLRGAAARCSITVDDAQWLDRASAEAIAFAARRLVADPVAILIAVREGEDSPFLGRGPARAQAGRPRRRRRRPSLLGRRRRRPRSRVTSLDRMRATRPAATRWPSLELGPERAADPALRCMPDLPIATSVERAYLRRADGLSEGARRSCW